MIRQQLRSVLRAPGFFAIAVLALGIALGLSTTVLALVDSVTHPTAPYRDAERLYSARLTHGPPRAGSGPLLIDQLHAMRAAPLIEEASAFFSYRAKIRIGAVIQEAYVSRYAPDLYAMLGLRPARGRLPTSQEAIAQNSVMISSALWREAFGGQSSIAGATLDVDDQTYTVVGVLPEAVKYPLSFSVTIPLSSEARLASSQYSARAGFAAFTVMRLKAGAIGKATIVGNQLAAQYDTRFGTSKYPFVLKFVALQPDPLGLRSYHKAMLAAAASILLIACANVAALLLARGIARRREYALRLALGASRFQLARLVLTETLILTIGGSALGMILAMWATNGVTSILPQELFWLGISEPRWSFRLFIESAGLVLCAAVIAGSLPAWKATRIQPAEPLKDSAPSAANRSGQHFRLLVVVELALALSLLIGTTLVIKGTLNVSRFAFGYDARPLLSAAIYQHRPDSSSTMGSTRESNDIATLIREVPGIMNAASFRRERTAFNTVVSGVTPAGHAGLQLYDGYLDVDAHFFETLGLKILEGRNFEDGDRVGDGTAILDSRAAHLLFPAGRAVGSRIKMGGLESKSAWLRVVGIVAPGRMEFPKDPDLESSPRVFTSTASGKNSDFDIVIRPERNAADVGPAVRRALETALSFGSRVVISPWAAGYEEALTIRRFIARVFIALSVSSLAMSASGLFSLLAYGVNQRLREFAVRVALGSGRGHVLTLVLRGALELILGGTAVGAFAGMWSGFLLQEYLYGVYPVDVGALALAEILFVVAMLLACVIPLIRAMRVSPVDIMRAT